MIEQPTPKRQYVRVIAERFDGAVLRRVEVENDSRSGALALQLALAFCEAIRECGLTLDQLAHLLQEVNAVEHDPIIERAAKVLYQGKG